MGASEVDTRAARCRAGVRDKWKAVRASIMGTVHKGRVRDKQGSKGRGHGQAGLHGVGSKGHGAAGRKGKGQGKEGGRGYMGSPVFPGKGLGWSEVYFRQPSPPSSRHSHRHLTQRCR